MREGQLLHHRPHGARLSRAAAPASTPPATSSAPTARTIRSPSSACRSTRCKAEIEQGIASVAAALGDRRRGGAVLPHPGPAARRACRDAICNRAASATWSADVVADDWKHISAAEVVRRAIARLDEKGKGILLLHDIQPATALALPELLRQLKTRGYRDRAGGAGQRPARRCRWPPSRHRRRPRSRRRTRRPPRLPPRCRELIERAQVPTASVRYDRRSGRSGAAPPPARPWRRRPSRPRPGTPCSQQAIARRLHHRGATTVRSRD